MAVTRWTNTSVNYTSNAAGGKNGLTTTDATYTVLVTDDIVLCNATAQNQIITLPSPVGVDGKYIILRRVNTNFNKVVIVPAAKSIGLYSQVTLQAPGQVLAVLSNGVDWIVASEPVRLYNNGVVMTLLDGTPVYLYA